MGSFLWRLGGVVSLCITLGLSSVYHALPLGCSSGGGLVGGEENGAGSAEGELIENAPVDIPVPIAKATDGIDPSSINLEETGDVGILSGSVNDSSSEKLVALVVDGEVVTTVTTSGGIFEFTITSELLSKPLALLVAAEGTTADNNGDWSLPVIVTVSAVADSDLYGGRNFTVTVTVTNTDSDTSGPITAANIELEPIFVSSSVLFSVTDSSGNGSIVKGNISGGTDIVETFFDGVIASSFETDSFGALVFTEEGEEVVHAFNQEGESVYTESRDLPLPGGPEDDQDRVRDATLLSDSDLAEVRGWMVVNTFTDSTTVLEDLTFINVDDSSEITPTLNIVGEPGGLPTDIATDFLNDGQTLIITQRVQSGDVGLATADILPIVDGSSTTLTVNTLLASNVVSLPRTGVAAHPATGNILYFCQPGGTGTHPTQHFCVYNLDAQNETVIFDNHDFRVDYFFISPAGTYAYFAATAVTDGFEDSIGVYLFEGDLNGQTAVLIGPGYFPTASEEDEKTVVYLSRDGGGTYQISVADLDNLFVLP